MTDSVCGIARGIGFTRIARGTAVSIAIGQTLVFFEIKPGFAFRGMALPRLAAVGQAVCHVIATSIIVRTAMVDAVRFALVGVQMALAVARRGDAHSVYACAGQAVRHRGAIAGVS